MIEDQRIQMSHSLQVLLEHLQDILKRDFIGRSVETSNVVSDIASHCQDFITVADIGRLHILIAFELKN